MIFEVLVAKDGVIGGVELVKPLDFGTTWLLTFVSFLARLCSLKDVLRAWCILSAIHVNVWTDLKVGEIKY